MTSYRNTQRNLKSPGVTENMTKELAIRLYMLGHYLRSCRSHLLRHLAKPQQSAKTTPSNQDLLRICLTSSEHYVQFSDAQLEEVHSTWLFIGKLLMELIERPHHLGTLEAIVRGMNEKPLGDRSLALSLVIGDLSIIRSVLQLRNFCTRKRMVLKFLSGFTNYARRRLLLRDNTLEELSLRQGPMKTLWVDGMLSEMIMRGLSADNVAVESTCRTTIALLKNLAGFDIFAHILGEEPDSQVVQIDLR